MANPHLPEEPKYLLKGAGHLYLKVGVRWDVAGQGT